MEKKAKPQLAVESALQTLAKGADMGKVMKDVGHESAALVEAKDVTANFLMPSKTESSSLEENPFFVYKGIIKKLEGC